MNKIKYPNTNIFVKTKYHSHFWINKLAKGKFELKCITLLTNIINKNDIIFDIGSWNGIYSLLFSKLVGNNGKVYSFEPDSLSYKICKKLLKKNKIKNVILNKIGLGIIKEKRKIKILY